MNKRSTAKRVLITLSLLSMIVSGFAYAGHHDDEHSPKDAKQHAKQQSKESKMAHKEKSKKEEIMREISYLSKKLLDISGEDSLVIKSDEVQKPFLGVCSMVKDAGVKLTCITPDSQADKHGLQTGDIITAINGISFAKSGLNEGEDHPYWGIMNAMKFGDVLKLELMRAGKTINIDAKVGFLSHPAYELRINR